MKILFITNLYPTKSNPDYGVFTKDQIDNVLKTGIYGDIIFVNAREKGSIEYLKAIFKIKKIYKNYDLIHCFHGLTLIIAFFATFKIPILISFLNEIKNESFNGNKFINNILVFIYKSILKSNRIFSIFKDKIPEDLTLKDHSFYLPNGIDLSDFYNVNGEIYFGELTLYHWSGLVPFEPEEWDFTFGNLIKLSDK